MERNPAGWLLIGMTALAIGGIGEFVAKLLDG